MNSPPGPFSTNRLIEWFFAAVMLFNAFTTAITYGKEPVGFYVILAGLGVTDALAIFAFSTFGGLRIAALYANGHWRPYGQYLRMAGSLAGALVWGNVAAVLLYKFAETGILYRSEFACCSAAAIFEVLSFLRAANDSRIGRFT